VVKAPHGATLINVVGERRPLKAGTSHPLKLTEDLVYVLGEATVTSVASPAPPPAPARQLTEEEIRNQDR